MSSSDTSPLLTICVPTHNRGRFLRVMLQALLPQVQDCGSEVEVCVLDNASSDDTHRIIGDSAVYGSFRSVRHSTNIGPARNILWGPMNEASGRFCWILGDHNLLLPGSLRRVLSVLREQQHLDVCYVNYRAASFAEHWPENAMGGYSGPFSYIGNKKIASGVVSEWGQLVQCESALCTPCYVHILRTDIWKSHWRGRRLAADYATLETTYPHTVTLVENCLRKPAAVIADPCITIFNGAQSWGTPEIRAKVYLRGLAELIKLFQRRGIDRRRCASLIADFFLPEARKVAVHVLQNECLLKSIKHLMSSAGLRPVSWYAIMRAIPEGLLPNGYRWVLKRYDALLHPQLGYLWNCRPARWLRKFGQ